MADETLDLGHLYDGVDLDELGGGHLYDDTELEPRITDDLLHRDMIVVQPMKPGRNRLRFRHRAGWGRLLLLLLVRASNQ